MSKETRIAILAIVAFAILIIGYKFIIGKSILSQRQYFYVKYKDIDQLQVSNPVLVNGFQVGAVNKIYLDPIDNTTPIVVLEVDKEIKVPKDAQAILISMGFMGGKAIAIQFKGRCTDDCAQTNDYLQAGSKSLLGNFVGEGEIENYVDKIKSSASDLFDTLAGPSGKKEIKQGVQNLEKTLENLAQSTTTLNNLLIRNSSKLDRLVTNLESVIGNIQKSNAEITNILKNVDAVAAQVKTSDVAKTMSEFNTTLKESKKAIEILQTSLKSADATLGSVNNLIKKAESGNGSAAKILNDPILYQNLSNTSKQLELLLQDFRLNPKRYVNVSVFGKKQKDYMPVDEDPVSKSDTLKKR